MTPAELIHQYGRWRLDRDACLEAEDNGGPGASRWEDSDDRAVELLSEARHIIEWMIDDNHRLREWLNAERRVLLVTDPAWREAYRKAREVRATAMWDVLQQMRYITYDKGGM